MSKEVVMDVAIVGGGIGGLALALFLHQRGIGCRVYEAIPEIGTVGAGINLLPHAVKQLDSLGLIPELDKVGIRTKDASYFNKYGQHIYTEPAGMNAGYKWPQYSIHRGDLQQVLLNAVIDRLGPDSVVTGHRCVGVENTGDGVTVAFEDPDGTLLDPVRARICVAADGIHSVIRKQFYPDEGEPVYSGLTIWRGVVPFKPFLSGANTIRVGWMPVGKIMVYPIRDNIDDEGNQLMNWVVTQERPKPDSMDWNKPAKLEDFFEPFKDWHFDWLDVPELLRQTPRPLIFPMVDRDPVETWTFGRTTLLGDAAHPMYPRGSNGAGQSILDGKILSQRLSEKGLTEEALQLYDKERVAKTAQVVLTNRKNPPDAILREVYERSGNQPFDRIQDLISDEELAEISASYKRIAGFAKEQLNAE
ncbi:flavin-dependent oxidoreductase [Salipiger abyssi]|uniref:2-polyprenyl-6-methoxyphenol hydroxylase-like oxidoreductase n=1 Tax=Salipiger abyssi TaxID=1250539 RepID=A0A1P8UMQ9_9RHOB|nr:flavin-dependent oxidoreductase [Salipiger abyssi]APZ50660.1 2-polyprenyl-6-methoxyphenol hydroxylase-like oxidoreductase [Salipiger abyssi]